MSILQRLVVKFCAPRASSSYAQIRYAQSVDPKQDDDRFLSLMTQDFKFVRERTDDECRLIGRFMSVAMLLERKLVRLLIGFDPEIERKMFGRKIKVYKDFLNAFEWDDDQEIDKYRALVAPLKEIKRIRDAMSHDLSKVDIKYDELRQTVALIKRRRVDLHDTFAQTENESLRSLGAVVVFGFLFSHDLAFLQCELE